MWMSERNWKLRAEEPAAELGTVTLGGDPAGVSLGSERRWIAVYGPGGYCWRPAAGDRVLVLRAGAEGEVPCVLGRVQEDGGLEPGEARLSGGNCSLHLSRDGLRLTGSVLVNGKRLEDMIREIAAAAPPEGG